MKTFYVSNRKTDSKEDFKEVLEQMNGSFDKIPFVLCKYFYKTSQNSLFAND